MERILVTAFYTVISGIIGVIIMFLTFAAAWSGAGGLIFGTVTSASCFLVPWFFTGIIDRYWYLFSAAVALPTLAMHTEILIENLKLGNLPGVIAIPLAVTVIASFAGGYARQKRNKEAKREGNEEGTAGSLY